jgi:hypothetical protein
MAATMSPKRSFMPLGRTNSAPQNAFPEVLPQAIRGREVHRSAKPGFQALLQFKEGESQRALQHHDEVHIALWAGLAPGGGAKHIDLPNAQSLELLPVGFQNGPHLLEAHTLMLAQRGYALVSEAPTETNWGEP